MEIKFLQSMERCIPLFHSENGQNYDSSWIIFVKSEIIWCHLNARSLHYIRSSYFLHLSKYDSFMHLCNHRSQNEVFHFEWSAQASWLTLSCTCFMKFSHERCYPFVALMIPIVFLMKIRSFDFAFTFDRAIMEHSGHFHVGIVAGKENVV